MTTTERELAALRGQVAEMAAQIEGLTAAIEKLYGLLTEKPAGGRRRAKVTPAQVGDLDKMRCYKARIARAARRYGLTVEEWLERFGPVDRLPPGVPRPAPTRPVVPYRRVANEGVEREG